MTNYRLAWDWDSPERIQQDTKANWVEKFKRFSESHLWAMQYDFYAQEGIDIWDSVPLFITSNPLLADVYLNCIFMCLCDHLDQLDSNAPIYIIELGAGHARFGFHMLNTLERKRQFFPQLAHLQFRYILTDYSEAQVQHWANNPLLKRWVAKGALDLAVFRPNQHAELVLYHSQEALNAKTVKNPVIAVGNYFYDSLPHDFFVTHDTGCDEVQVSLYRTQTDNTATRKGVYDVALAFSRHPIKESYYEAPEWNELLTFYSEHCRPNTEISLPVGGFHTLNNLRTLSQNRLMLLTADKTLEPPSLFLSLRARHSTREACSAFTLIGHNGAFSVDVNYHALAHLTAQLGGTAYSTKLTTASLNIQANTFLPNKPDSPWFNYYMNEVLNTNNPIASVSNRMGMLDDADCNSQEQLIGVLKCLFQLIADSHYDPYLFKRYEYLLNDLPQFHDLLATFVEDLLDRCRDNLFTIPASDNAYHIMGVLYRCCSLPEKAINLLIEGLERFGGALSIYNLLSLCYSDCRDYSSALIWGQNALDALQVKLSKSEGDAKDKWVRLEQAIESRMTMWRELVTDTTLSV